MCDFPSKRLSEYFGVSFEDAYLKTRMADYLSKLKVSEPILYMLLQRLHAYYPITLDSKDGESPTLIVIAACEKEDIHREYSLSTEHIAREYLMPKLTAYFNSLAYGRKCISDKMPTKWDCTDSTLEAWSKQAGVRRAYISTIPVKQPSTLSDYQRGVLIAKIALGTMSDNKVTNIQVSNKKFKSIEFPHLTPIALRRWVDKVSMTHSGIAHVCNHLYRHYGTVQYESKPYIDSIIQRAGKVWTTSLDENNIPVAYRDFVDCILEGLNELFCAKVSGKTKGGEYFIWEPHSQSLKEWVTKHDIDGIDIEWGALKKTYFEIIQSRISIMRVVLRRVDLTLWGIPLPGDYEVSVSV
ncbi:hypothetical protein [Aliidiomarina quisquiliarum]|uniref:hypothetical protein n=1 Tax=Aliidiomarina quisquiliarum TaxID=2938947 RepID=UPI00208E2825|nr:hypothetical protein [Aliidiomarina quisquiliarum]MCO4319911.1 hypothetical protein [Aliidiomarina quisquiliarum]